MIPVYVTSSLIILLYAFTLLKYSRYWKKVPVFFIPHSEVSIFISVIVPFRNEKNNLENLINSLNTQTLNKKNFEVIFVNDNSVDDSINVIKHLSGKFNCRIVNNDSSGKKAALRTGWKNAKAEIIVTADADCVYPENWLKTIAGFYKINNPDMVIMPVINSEARTFWQNFQNIDFLALQLTGAGSALAGNPVLCNGANLSYKKFREMPQLNDSYASGEDIFILEWMKKKNKNIRYLKSAEVLATTPPPPDFNSFIRQRSRWISKAGGYKDKSLILISLLIFLANLIPLLLLSATIFNKLYLVLWGVFFFVKTLIDYSFIRSGIDFFNLKTSLPVFMIMQFLYPFYMMTVVIKGFILPVKWK
ncbi:MAG: glycosyltransferase [Chlorobi bacterium]|nr:glycosyltransferase [Chlorobiota bacterium]